MQVPYNILSLYIIIKLFSIFLNAANPRQRYPKPAGGTSSPEQQRLRAVVGQRRWLRVEGHPLRVDLLHVRLPHRGHPHERLRVGIGLRCHMVTLQKQMAINRLF